MRQNDLLQPRCGDCEIYQKMLTYRSRMRKQLLSDIYQLKSVRGGTLEETGEYYGYRFVPAAFQMLVLNFVDKLPGTNPQRLQAAMMRAEEILRETLLPAFPEGELCITDDFLICLVNMDALPGTPELAPYQRQIARSFDVLCASPALGSFHIVMGEGPYCTGISELRSSFDSAVDALQRAILEGYNKRYDGEKSSGSPLKQATISPVQLSALETGLLSRNAMALEDWVHQIFEDFRPQFEKSPSLAFLLPRSIMQNAFTLSGGLPGAELLAHSGDRLAHCVTLEQEQAVLIDVFRQYCQAGQLDIHPGVARVLSHLSVHYREQLSLDALGKIAGLNPQYLTVLFRQETGETITQYIQKLRLHLAQELLTTTSLSIFQIAQETGYPDARYFSRVFRRTFGQTPQSYRSSRTALE